MKNDRRFLIIGATGHRPPKLGGYSDFATQSLIQFAVSELAKLVLEGHELKFISGMALGWDQAVAKACIQLDIPFIAAVPFIGQENAWPLKSREDYQTLLLQAEEVVYVCPGGYAPYKMQVRNEYMVNNSDWTLALWDGTDGGTANCVRYANKAQKPVRNIWNEWSKFLTK